MTTARRQSSRAAAVVPKKRKSVAFSGNDDDASNTNAKRLSDRRISNTQQAEVKGFSPINAPTTPQSQPTKSITASRAPIEDDDSDSSGDQHTDEEEVEEHQPSEDEDNEEEAPSTHPFLNTLTSLRSQVYEVLNEGVDAAEASQIDMLSESIEQLQLKASSGLNSALSRNVLLHCQTLKVLLEIENLRCQVDTGDMTEVELEVAVKGEAEQDDDEDEEESDAEAGGEAPSSASHQSRPPPNHAGPPRNTAVNGTPHQGPPGGPPGTNSFMAIRPKDGQGDPRMQAQHAHQSLPGPHGAHPLPGPPYQHPPYPHPQHHQHQHRHQHQGPPGPPGPHGPPHPHQHQHQGPPPQHNQQGPPPHPQQQRGPPGPPGPPGHHHHGPPGPPSHPAHHGPQGPHHGPPPPVNFRPPPIFMAILTSQRWDLLSQVPTLWVNVIPGNRYLLTTDGTIVDQNTRFYMMIRQKSSGHIMTKTRVSWPNEWQNPHDIQRAIHEWHTHWQELTKPIDMPKPREEKPKPPKMLTAAPPGLNGAPPGASKKKLDKADKPKRETKKYTEEEFAWSKKYVADRPDVDWKNVTLSSEAFKVMLKALNDTEGADGRQRLPNAYHTWLLRQRLIGKGTIKPGRSHLFEASMDGENDSPASGGASASPDPARSKQTIPGAGMMSMGSNSKDDDDENGKDEDSQLSEMDDEEVEGLVGEGDDDVDDEELADAPERSTENVAETVHHADAGSVAVSTSKANIVETVETKAEDEIKTDADDHDEPSKMDIDD